MASNIAKLPELLKQHSIGPPRPRGLFFQRKNVVAAPANGQSAGARAPRAAEGPKGGTTTAATLATKNQTE
jgi:hypothetical protein